MKKQQEAELSIIILTYNVQNVIIPCLDSVFGYLRPGWEVIVVDNASSDKTINTIKGKKYPGIKIIENQKNLGFSSGNNIVAKKVFSEFVLFLNPDTVVEKDSISFPLEYLKKHPEVGAASVKVVLGNGELDDSCHRGFPTPWNAFCYFSGLSKVFPKTKLFSGYTLGYMDLNQPHEVDSINGAFWMMKRELGNKLGWFDEDFFWKGEDLDFCFRIKKEGYKIMYLPQEKITHYKGSSKGHQKGSKTYEARFDVMRLFYQKHYKDRYPKLVKELVFLGIDARKFLSSLGV